MMQFDLLILVSAGGAYCRLAMLAVRGFLLGAGVGVNNAKLLLSVCLYGKVSQSVSER